jgi:uncharacterized repeat protein (TIGR03803 family)
MSMPTNAEKTRSEERVSSSKRGARALGLLLALPIALAAGTAHAQAYSVLHAFSGAPDGSGPQGGLIRGVDGNFYGTTTGGGVNDLGAVYRMTPAGAVTLVHSMAGVEAATPFGELVLGADGNFYGTTALGGTGVFDGKGVVYRVTPSGALTTLHVFTGADGQHPETGLLLAADGNFYGTATGGGATGNGTVFRISASGTFTVLHSFTGSDGGFPLGALIAGSDGNFYGTTVNGGSANGGTVYRISPSGTFSSLHSFTFAAQDGNDPRGALVLGSDGNFYGTTEFGGAGGGHGTTYRMTPSGAVTVLHAFTGFDGDAPLAGLTLARDGRFYGTTSTLGQNGSGTIFSMTAAGAVTVQRALSSSDGSPGEAKLLQASDGAIYGANLTGPGSSLGDVFKLVPGPAFASPLVQVNTPYFTEDDVTLTTAVPLTALTITITMQITPGVTFSGQFQNVGSQFTQSHVTTTSAITYTFTLKAGSTVPAGTWTFAAQAGTSGVAHNVHGDTFTVSYTAGAQGFAQSGSY